MKRIANILIDTIIKAVFWGSYYYHTAKFWLQKHFNGNTDKFKCSKVTDREK